MKRKHAEEEHHRPRLVGMGSFSSVFAVEGGVLKVGERDDVEREWKVYQRIKGHRGVPVIHEIVDVADTDVVNAHRKYELTPPFCALRMPLLHEGQWEDMKKWATRGGLQTVHEVAAQLMEALAWVHSRGHVHHDVKPQNIMFRRPPSEGVELVLIDFNAWEESGHYIVTRWYRPPEVILRLDAPNGKRDVWSAGCVVGELLRGGKALFAADNAKGVLQKIRAFTGDLSRDCLDVDLEGTFDEICGVVTGRMLQADPQARSVAQDCADLLRSIKIVT